MEQRVTPSVIALDMTATPPHGAPGVVVSSYPHKMGHKRVSTREALRRKRRVQQKSSFMDAASQGVSGVVISQLPLKLEPKGVRDYSPYEALRSYPDVSKMAARQRGVTAAAIRALALKMGVDWVQDDNPVKHRDQTPPKTYRFLEMNIPSQ
eukprot:g25471.t1